MEIRDYATAGGKNIIMEYIDALPVAEKTEILEVRRLIFDRGIEAFSLLTTRQLYRKLWEIKVSKERVMYIIQDEDTVYFLNICKKQKGKAEKQELEKAKRRARAEGLL